jgi:hypothetical protein
MMGRHDVAADGAAGRTPAGVLALCAQVNRLFMDLVAVAR